MYKNSRGSRGFIHDFPEHNPPCHSVVERLCQLSGTLLSREKRQTDTTQMVHTRILFSAKKPDSKGCYCLIPFIGLSGRGKTTRQGSRSWPLVLEVGRVGHRWARGNFSEFGVLSWSHSYQSLSDCIDRDALNRYFTKESIRKAS